jgi:iron complex outermembrane receptor protein
LIRLEGSDAFDAEELLAWEVGYRTQPTDHLSFDIATFYNEYDNLRTLEPGTPSPAIVDGHPVILAPVAGANKMEGNTCGVEVAADWKMATWWRWRASYTYLELDLSPDGSSLDTTAADAEGQSPEHQAVLHAILNPTHRTEVDAVLRYVDALPAFGVPSYTEADLRLAWRPREHLELALIGRNLLESQHKEFASLLVNTAPTEVERSLFGRVTWTF